MHRNNMFNYNKQHLILFPAHTEIGIQNSICLILNNDFLIYYQNNSRFYSKAIYSLCRKWHDFIWYQNNIRLSFGSGCVGTFIFSELSPCCGLLVVGCCWLLFLNSFFEFSTYWYTRNCRQRRAIGS